MNRVQQHIHALRTARRITLQLLEGIASDAWLFQPIPTGQHALWIIGHLVTADDWGLISVGQPARHFEHLDAPFGSGSPISAIAADYPPHDEVLSALYAAHERFMSGLERITDADLDRPTTGPIADYAPNLGTLLISHAWHEGFHSGQLALIRRALGLPVCMG